LWTAAKLSQELQSDFPSDFAQKLHFGRGLCRKTVLFGRILRGAAAELVQVYTYVTPRADGRQAQFFEVG